MFRDHGAIFCCEILRCSWDSQHINDIAAGVDSIKQLWTLLLGFSRRNIRNCATFHQMHGFLHVYMPCCLPQTWKHKWRTRQNLVKQISVAVAIDNNDDKFITLSPFQKKPIPSRRPLVQFKPPKSFYEFLSIHWEWNDSIYVWYFPTVIDFWSSIKVCFDIIENLSHHVKDMVSPWLSQINIWFQVYI